MARKKNYGNTIFHITEAYLNKHYDLRKNVVRNVCEYRSKKAEKFELLNESNLFVELQKQGINIPINKLCALLCSNFVPDFNPFVEYFESLPAWDGQDHISTLANHVKVTAPSRFNTQFSKWLVRSVKTAIDDNFFNKQAVILISEQQNSGKSTWCRFLCPPKLHGYIKENINTDKDSLVSLTSNFLINLDELSTMNRRDINDVKSMLSKDFVNERLVYARHNSYIPRRCSFVGSTNNFEFLCDTSGTVRWLCFEVTEIDWNYKTRIDIDKVYAQAYYLLNSDTFKFDFSKEEILENEIANESYFVIMPEIECIQKHFLPGDAKDKFMTTTEILSYIQSENPSLRYNFNLTNIGKCLRKLGFEQKSERRSGSLSVKGYYVKVVMNAPDNIPI